MEISETMQGTLRYRCCSSWNRSHEDRVNAQGHGFALGKPRQAIEIAKPLKVLNYERQTKATHALYLSYIILSIS